MAFVDGAYARAPATPHACRIIKLERSREDRMVVIIGPTTW